MTSWFKRFIALLLTCALLLNSALLSNAEETEATAGTIESTGSSVVVIDGEVVEQTGRNYPG